MDEERVDPELLKAAEAVSDARPVDWEVGTGAPADLGRTLAKLRVLESIAGVHRGGATALGEAPPDGGAFRWGPLVARERIGDGAFSEVWRAWDPELRREVALKLRRDGANGHGARRWLEEAPRLARVRHPNVVTVYGAAVHDGRAGMWMEQVRGLTFEQWLARHGRLGAREAALVGVDLCGALAAVHAAGLLHGDLKAANVMREGAAGPEGDDARAGRTVLMDFGAGSDLADGDARPGFATPLACAPEVLDGGAASPASDLYGLGALLFRLVSGRHPVEGDSLVDLRARLARGERESLRGLRPDLPAGFVAVVERALERDPAARFPDAGAMERALLATLAPALPAASAASAVRPRRTGWMLAGAAAAAALATVLATRSIHLDRPATTPLPGRAAGAAAGAPVPAPMPPAATRAPAASASAPAALEARAQFFRAGDGGAERLDASAEVAPGDRLYLEVQADEPVYAYVFNEDDHGRLYTLFPLAALEQRNPLPAGGRVRLPGRSDGRAKDWRVSSAGGREHFLAVLSRRPLPELESEVASLEHAAPAPVSAPGGVAAGPTAMRGVGELADAPADAAGAGRLAALAERLRRRGSPDVWWRTLVLRNPGP